MANAKGQEATSFTSAGHGKGNERGNNGRVKERVQIIRTRKRREKNRGRWSGRGINMEK